MDISRGSQRQLRVILASSTITSFGILFNFTQSLDLFGVVPAGSLRNQGVTGFLLLLSASLNCAALLHFFRLSRPTPTSKEIKGKEVEAPALVIRSEAPALVIRSIESLLQQLKSEKPSSDPDAVWHREGILADAHHSQWRAAAQYFELQISESNAEANWEFHFCRGVSYANAGGEEYEIVRAIRAYSDAIAILPGHENKNIRARLYAYRGALFRKLDRYEEAQSDLLLARDYASRPYESEDITYNLAALYAQTGQRDKMLGELRVLLRDQRWKDIIHQKKRYFEPYWTDQELQKLLGS